MKHFVLLIFSFSFNIGLFSQVFDELMKVVAADRGAVDRFGWAVDIHEDVAVVGAYGDDFGDLDPNMGSVYVYEKTGGEWIQIQKLINSDQEDYDRFGWSVAIDGDYIVVGAYGEDDDEIGENTMSKAGSAYIFERGDDGLYTEIQKIVAADRAAGDEFGFAVEIHGNTIVVGAHIDDKDELGGDPLYHAGSVYIFDRAIDGVWSQSQKIVAPDRSEGTVYEEGHEDWNDRFGYSLGIWNDYLVVGAPFATKAYVFERSGGFWSHASNLTYPGINFIDRAGISVAIDSTTIVIGAQTEDLDADGEAELTNAGAAIIYKRVAPEFWILHQKITPGDRHAGDHFGSSVSIFEDFVVVGTHSDDHDEFDEDVQPDAGSLYLFERQEDESFLEIKKLDASDRHAEDELGICVAIHGNTIIAGAFQQDEIPGGGDYLEDAGAAYFYTNDPDDPGDGCLTVTHEQSITICFDTSYEIGDSVYSSSGTYTNTLTNALGCDSIVTTELTVLEEYFNEEDVEICFGTSYEIGDATYTESGTYTTILVGESGCDSTVVSHLTIGDEISSEMSHSLCYGESITVGENTYTTSGTYTDILTAINGCDSVITSIITVADEINTSLSVSGLTITSPTVGLTYQWYNCDTETIIDGATENTFTATENGNYSLIITNDDCHDTTGCILIIGVGIENENTIEDIKIYPNPSQGVFMINGTKLEGLNYRIYNVLGETIITDRFTSNQSSFNLEGIGEGIYFLQLEGSTETRKIILTK
ncbi:T9SS type A sorting domain-containing protein [Crocinitomix algicola]|uniref:T9SS type A sorting domain-containing protein n=1 Tax=Crocinitomix algicola TaxID=1740263 RepID=UPI0008723A2C|nr:T9SS type A sorting domain-containing protein [Crocinitomix algicola]